MSWFWTFSGRSFFLTCATIIRVCFLGYWLPKEVCHFLHCRTLTSSNKVSGCTSASLPAAECAAGMGPTAFFKGPLCIVIPRTPTDRLLAPLGNHAEQRAAGGGLPAGGWATGNSGREDGVYRRTALGRRCLARHGLQSLDRECCRTDRAWQRRSLDGVRSGGVGSDRRQSVVPGGA